LSIKVSVIIPVYNAEKYISQCIDSLLNQTLTDCEFIFVNDGSKDNSGAIINEYKVNDNRIKLVNQPNQGVSVARNAGLQVAAGEYIGFVDADDYVERDMFETLYVKAKEKNCDVVVSNYESYIKECRTTINLPFNKNITLNREYIESRILPNFLKADNLNAIWNKIYKKKLIVDKNVRFPEGVPLGEDALFNITFFSYATNVCFLNYSGYHYLENEGSATRDFKHTDYFQRVIDVFNTEIPEINNVIKDMNLIKSLKAIKLINNVMSMVYIYLAPIKSLGIKKRYIFVKKMVENIYVREALHIIPIEFQSALGRYERLIIKLVEKKSIIGLFFATAYSRYRNR
jgi:glycosyltransferase involved in cell wall biosynthesis